MFKLGLMVKPKWTLSEYKNIASKCPMMITYFIEALENHNLRMLQWWKSSRPALQCSNAGGSPRGKKASPWLVVEPAVEQKLSDFQSRVVIRTL